MASLHFLLASLPELEAFGEAPLDYEAFLSACEGNVSNHTLKKLRELSFNMNGWTEANDALMGEVNSQRTARLQKALPSAADRDPVIVQLVSSLLDAKNPLEAEKLLLDAQFSLIDSLVGLHSFDETALFGYALKLKLIERQSRFKRSEGKAEFDRILFRVQQSVYAI